MKHLVASTWLIAFNTFNPPYYGRVNETSKPLALRIPVK